MTSTTGTTIDELHADIAAGTICAYPGAGETITPAAYWYFQHGGKYMAVTDTESLDDWWDGDIPHDLGGIPLRVRIDQTDWLLDTWSPREFIYRIADGTERHIRVPNPNDNCLDDMSCPRCGATHAFDIDATVTVKVTDDGTDDIIDGYHWDDTSGCTCRQCGHNSTVLAFSEEGRA